MQKPDLENMIGRLSEESIGLEYDMYCFQVSDNIDDAEDEVVDQLYELREQAEEEGLGVMSDEDGDSYWIGCLLKEKDKYPIVDKYFALFNAIPDCMMGFTKPVETVATYDGIVHNSYGEDNPFM